MRISREVLYRGQGLFWRLRFVSLASVFVLFFLSIDASASESICENALLPDLETKLSFTLQASPLFAQTEMNRADKKEASKAMIQMLAEVPEMFDAKKVDKTGVFHLGISLDRYFSNKLNGASLLLKYKYNPQREVYVLIEVRLVEPSLQSSKLTSEPLDYEGNQIRDSSSTYNIEVERGQGGEVSELSVIGGETSATDTENLELFNGLTTSAPDSVIEVPATIPKKLGQWAQRMKILSHSDLRNASGRRGLASLHFKYYKRRVMSWSIERLKRYGFNMGIAAAIMYSIYSPDTISDMVGIATNRGAPDNPVLEVVEDSTSAPSPMIDSVFVGEKSTLLELSVVQENLDIKRQLETSDAQTVAVVYDAESGELSILGTTEATYESEENLTKILSLYGDAAIKFLSGVLGELSLR